MKSRYLYKISYRPYRDEGITLGPVLHDRNFVNSFEDVAILHRDYLKSRVLIVDESVRSLDL